MKRTSANFSDFLINFVSLFARDYMETLFARDIFP
jgi:hypothetical protein